MFSTKHKSCTLSVLIVTAFIILISSCRDQEIYHDNEINLDRFLTLKKTDVMAEDIFKSLTFIHPENCTGGLIGRFIGKVWLHKEWLIVKNEDQHVQVYDKQGKFIFATKKGKGPGEIIHVNDFTINTDRDEICVLDWDNPGKATRLKVTGQFIGTFPILKFSTTLAYLGQGRYCFFIPFHFHPENGINYDFLYVSDTVGTVLSEKKLVRGIHDSPFVRSQYFNSMPEGALYQADYWDTIIKVTPKGFSNDLILNYGGLKMPEKYWEDLNLYHQHSPQNYLVSFLYSPSTYFFTYSYECKKENGRVIYNEANGTVISITPMEGESAGIHFGAGLSGFSLWPNSVNPDGRLMMVVDVSKIKEFMADYPVGSSPFYDEAYQKLCRLDTLNDNPVIIVGELK